MNKCSIDLIKKFNGNIFSIQPKNAKRIKQINPHDLTEIYYNNINEVSKKLGINSLQLNKAIKNKIIYNGFLWEFVN